MGGGGQSSGGSGDAYSNLWQHGSGGSDWNWGAIGRGAQGAGSAIASSAPQQNYSQYAQYSPSQGNQYPVGAIPEQRRQTSEDTQALIEALRRIEATQRASKTIIPHEGAAKYWYVDPKAQGYGGDAGMLPEGTQPSF